MLSSSLLALSLLPGLDPGPDVQNAPPRGAELATGPFSSGLRWSYSSPATDPWIPRSVAFVGSGEYLWAAPAVATPQLTLFHTGQLGDPSLPLWVDGRFDGALGEIRVGAGDTVGELFALAQFPDPDSQHRRSVLYRYDAFEAARTGVFDPVWDLDLAGRGAAPAQLAVAEDGTTLCVAVQSEAGDKVRVEWFDGASGTSMRVEETPAGALLAMASSADARSVAVALSDRIVLFPSDPNATEVVFSQGSATTLGLSGDGQRLAYGAFTQAGVIEVRSGSFVELSGVPGASGEIVTRVAISRDGRNFALGWWDLGTAATVRCELRAALGGEVLSSAVQTTTPGGFQNYPATVAMNRGGERALFGTWGVGGSEPEVIVLSEDRPDPLVSYDLSGSVMAAAIDAGGTRFAIAHKELHANQFSTRGSLRLFDTGERGLQVLGAQRPGGSLEAVFETAPGGRVLFAVGTPLATPRTVPFASGQLFLDLTQPRVTLGARADAFGLASVSVPIGNDLALVGLSLALQAVEIAPGAIRLSADALTLAVF